MLETNMFQRLFNPERSDLLGLIGTAVGNPSISSGIAGEVNQQLSDLAKQNGGNLQKAVLDFYSSPQGVQMATQDPKGMDSTVKAWVSNTTAPQPQLTNPGQQGFQTTPMGTQQVIDNPPLPQQVGPGNTMVQGRTAQPQFSAPHAPMSNAPGSAIVNPNPGGGTIASQPTAQFQTTQRMIDASGAQPQEAADIYKQQVQTVEGRMGQAIDNLVRAGELSPALANKFKAGALEFKEDKDMYGTGIGVYRLYDKTTGNIIGGSPAVQNLDPALAAPSQSTTFDPSNPNHTMHLGSGVIAQASNIAGQAGRMLTGPVNNQVSDASLIADKRRQEITRVQSALADLQSNAGGLGIAEAKVKRMVANGPSLDLIMDPQTNLNRIIGLHDDVTGEIAAEKRIISRATPEGSLAPVEAKKHAAERIVAYERVLRSLPPREVLDQAKVACDKGNCGSLSPSPGDLLSQGKDLVKKGSKTGSEVINGPASDTLSRIPKMTEGELLAIDPKSRRDPAVRDAMRKRDQELRSGPAATPYSDEVTPGRPQDTQSFIRNPDGSTRGVSATQSRIEEAFRILSEAHGAGLVEETPRRRTAPKRRQ